MTCRMGVHDAHSVAGQLDRFLFPALCIRWQRTWSSAGHLAWPRRSVPARGEPPKPCDAPASLPAQPVAPDPDRRRWQQAGGRGRSGPHAPAVAHAASPCAAATLASTARPQRVRCWRSGTRPTDSQHRSALSTALHDATLRCRTSFSLERSSWRTGALEPGLCRGALSHYLAVEAKYSRSPPIEP